MATPYLPVMSLGFVTSVNPICRIRGLYNVLRTTGKGPDRSPIESFNVLLGRQNGTAQTTIEIAGLEKQISRGKNAIC